MKKIIIFGAGESKGGLNKYAIRKAERMGMEVLFLVDNDEKKHNTIFWCSDNMNKQMFVRGGRQYKIFPAEHIADVMDEDTFIIIATEVEHKEIEQQLINLGVEKDKFSYIKRMKDFYNYNEHLYEQFEEGVIGKVKNDKIYPISVRLDLTTYCNLRCEYCPQHGKVFSDKNVKSRHMEMNVLKEIVRQIKDYGTIKEIINVRSGELFMHPQWFEMSQYIAENTGISKFEISTNGMLLNEKNIDKLLKLKYEKFLVRISIDGRNKEENDSYRKGSKYDVIRENVHMLLSKMDKRFKVMIFNTLLTSEHKAIEVMNGSLDECKYLVEEFGNKVIYYSSPARMFAPYYPQYNEAIIDCLNLSDIKIMHRDLNGNACSAPFCDMAFDVEGNILMCNCQPDKDIILGNIMKDNALDIWNDTYMQRVRECYKNGISVKECESCDLNRGKDYYEYILCK